MTAKFMETLKQKIQLVFNSAHQEVAEKNNATQLTSLKNIMAQLTNLPAERAHFLATFAFILYRVAYADTNLSVAENNKIKNIIQQWSHIPEEQATLVAEIAGTENTLWGNTENFLMVREFKEIASKEDIIHLLHCLFAVAASDDSITNNENESIRKISKELNIAHDEFINIRRNFNDKLAALQAM